MQRDAVFVSAVAWMERNGIRDDWRYDPLNYAALHPGYKTLGVTSRPLRLNLKQKQSRQPQKGYKTNDIRHRGQQHPAGQRRVDAEPVQQYR